MQPPPPAAHAVKTASQQYLVQQNETIWLQLGTFFALHQHFYLANVVQGVCRN